MPKGTMWQDFSDLIVVDTEDPDWHAYLLTDRTHTNLRYGQLIHRMSGFVKCNFEQVQQKYSLQ